MPFVHIPGVEGLVFEPEQEPDSSRRHKCPDCLFCQHCGEDRCRVCMNLRKARSGKTAPRRRKKCTGCRHHK